MNRDYQHTDRQPGRTVTQKTAGMTVFVSIGNSDNRLTQQEWSEFWTSVDMTIHLVVQAEEMAGRVHGTWVSPSTVPYQNACWAFSVSPDSDAVWDADGEHGVFGVRESLRDELQDIARKYRQQWIMWAETVPEFLPGMDGT